MAKNKGLLPGFSGLIGPVILKQYTDKTVITSKPDMSRVKRTKPQKNNSSAFASAVGYAKKIVNDPAKKKEFAKKLKRGESVYHAAIKEWLNKNRS
jgi:hypothetical protein